MTNQQPDFAQKLLRGGVIITFFSLITSPLGYIIRVILSRSLSIEEYGIFYALISFFGLFAVFNDLGFGYSVTYFIPKFLKERNYQKIWSLYIYDQIIELSTSILMSLLLIVSSGWIATYFFKMPEAQSLIVIFSCFFIVNSGFSALQKFYTGIQQEKYYSSMNFFRLFITTLLIYIFWLKGISNIQLYAWSWVAGYAFVAITYSIIQYTQYSQFVKRLIWDKKLFHQMLKYAIPTLFITSISLISGYIDTFILTIIKGVREVGIYNVVFPLAATASFLFSPILSMFIPLISQHHHDDTSIVETIINKLLLILPLFGVFVCLFIFLYTESVIGILFSNQWIANSSFPLKILSLFYTFSLISMFLATVISGLGKVKEHSYVILRVVLLQIIIGCVLTYYFGVLGTVLSNGLVYMIFCWWYLKLIKRDVNVVLPWRAFIKSGIFVIVLAIAFSSLNFQPNTFIQLLSIGVLYSIVYILGMFLIHKQELMSSVKLLILALRPKNH